MVLTGRQLPNVMNQVQKTENKALPRESGVKLYFPRLRKGVKVDIKSPHLWEIPLFEWAAEREGPMRPINTPLAAAAAGAASG